MTTLMLGPYARCPTGSDDAVAPPERRLATSAALVQQTSVTTALGGATTRRRGFEQGERPVTVIANSVSVDRPPLEVFDALSDPRSELHWNPKVERMELIGGEPLGVGSRFHAKWKLSKPLILEIARFERPRGWSYRNGGPVTVNLDVTLSPQGAGTLLSTRFDARPNGAFLLIFPLFLIAIRREEKSNMHLLQSWLEARPAAAHD